MKALSKPIICCGFTPCIQRIVEFEKLQKGEVNRALKTTIGSGGKGANAARMVCQLGGQSFHVGFAGGENGRRFEALLKAEEIEFRHVQVEGETRICQTLLESGNAAATELVEEMPPISSDEWSRMVSLFESLDLSGVVAVSGKLPAGAPVDAYAQVCAMVHKKGGRVILDAPGEPLLLTLGQNPELVKINDQELYSTIGGADLKLAAQNILERGAQAVLITCGGGSAFYADKDQQFEIIPPQIEAVNPVGSGDAAMAGLAVSMAQKLDIEATLKTAMSCGAANALNLISGTLNSDDVARLKEQVLVKAI